MYIRIVLPDNDKIEHEQDSMYNVHGVKVGSEQRTPPAEEETKPPLVSHHAVTYHWNIPTIYFSWPGY